MQIKVRTSVFSWLLYYTVSTVHTKSFWNIIIQWTSHDDLTEKSAGPNCALTKYDGSSFFVKSQSAVLNLLLFNEFYRDCPGLNLQIDLEAKRMDGSSWKKFILY
jgi:hypothetical protein